MRRLGVVRLDALQFQRFHGAGLALDFFLQALQQFTLLDDDGVQLLNLMLEVGEVGFEFVGAPGIFFSHETILPPPPPEVERLPDGRPPAQIWWGERPREPDSAFSKRLAGTLAPPNEAMFTAGF